MSKPGFVYLVGAGPGDPGLITVKGLDCLQRADSILYDGLVNPLLLRHTSAHAERTCRSMGSHGKWLNQSEINEHLITEARAGKTVVRLKGGDPYIFGRGSEEAAALEEAGIAYEVVPGITAATAAAVYAGLSLTHRDFASAVAYVTGHEDPAKEDSTLDYESLAHFSGTLVFYMGLHRLPLIAEKLIAAGKPANTPACVVRRATWTDQRALSSTLAELPTAVKEAGFKAPSLIIVGDCVQQREQIDWFCRRPLLGKRIGITRPEVIRASSEKENEPDNVDRVIHQCWELGAEPVLIPTMQIRPVADATLVVETMQRIDQYDWLIFTSENGVQFFHDFLWAAGKDARAFSSCKLAAIGSSTAAALERYHLRADLVPEEFRAEGLAAALKPHVDGKRLLWVRANRGRDILPEELRPHCDSFEELVVYEHTDIENWSPETVQQIQQGGLDWIGVSSPAIARRLKYLQETHLELSDALEKTRYAALSPVTSQAADEIGLPISATAEVFTWNDLLNTISQNDLKKTVQ
ncbi:Uroporphyrinogen-III C-methyltransferase [Polystyrenella longa]|uniref:uroporphyrinogen-III C-methyltransferase n=1 Tax=Polystyrenella longa TaxID=2528007 RepID=A0A518CS67_9PLAN|nr:uroporphyrinogen-III C-methyltransferase [Polystyrenella longa]QDU82060.1 Uroporphyrinogen-III C-methyltransferase [Polystyrenella longa]